MKRLRKDRQALVTEHVWLVEVIAHRVRQNLPVHISIDELISAGTMGLMDAAIKFDGRRKKPFSTYAKYRIKGAMLDSLRMMDWASRDVRSLKKKTDAAIAELSACLLRTPTDEEVAQKLGVSLQQWQAHQRVLADSFGPLSGSTRGTDEDLPHPDFTGPNTYRPDCIAQDDETRRMLHYAIAQCNDRYRKAIDLYFFRELPMKEVGQIMGINESRVSQIIAAALKKARLFLEDRGLSQRSFAACA